MSQTDNFQWNIRQSIQQLHKDYFKNPWTFMTEADVQCALYMKLSGRFHSNKRTFVTDASGKKIKEENLQLLTKSLHAELQTTRRKTIEYVDLCIIPQKYIEFYVMSRRYDKSQRIFPIYGWDWNPEDAIGIEIKFNRWVSQRYIYSLKTKRTRTTQKWHDFYESLAFDLQKLKRYKRGWFVFVDQHSLFQTKEEWREFMDALIRYANYGAAKKTLNAYYLCPKNNSAWPFKSVGQTVF